MITTEFIVKKLESTLKNSNLPAPKIEVPYYYLQGSTEALRTKNRRCLLHICSITSSLHAFCCRGTTHDLFEPYLIHISSAGYENYEAVFSPLMEFLTTS